MIASGTAIPTAAIALLIGLFFRLRIGWLRRLYIPAAAVGGLIGFVVLQSSDHTGSPAVAAWGAAIGGEWRSWPGTLIAVVFAGLLLEPTRDGQPRGTFRGSVRSAILAWIIILGQIAIGLAVYLLAVRPFHPNVPATFGQILEVSWAGGPGSSAAMGTLYAAAGFPEGRDLAFFMSTVGLIYGVVSGLVFVNIAVRRGWTTSAVVATDTAPEDEATHKAMPSLSPSVIDPLAVQVIILAIAYGAGLLLRWLFGYVAVGLLGPDDPNVATQAIDAAMNLPLFLFTLLGGWLVRRTMQAVGLTRWIDPLAIRHMLGVAMEFLIFAGIATIRVDALGAFFVPLLLLFAAAAAWSAVCLLVLSRPLLPREHWFELALLNYGFSTANTPQGLMLLRIVDPQLTSGAAETYAVAAPLSAPFVGGGIVTFLVLPLALRHWPPVVVLGLITAGITALLSIGLLAVRRAPPTKALPSPRR